MLCLSETTYSLDSGYPETAEEILGITRELENAANHSMQIP